LTIYYFVFPNFFFWIILKITASPIIVIVTTNASTPISRVNKNRFERNSWKKIIIFIFEKLGN